MAIFEFAPAIQISRKIVREKTNQAVLRLVPEAKSGEVAGDKTVYIFSFNSIYQKAACTTT